MPNNYQIKQDVVDKIMRLSGDDVISGYLTGQKFDDRIVIDSFVTERTAANVHVKPKKWMYLKKNRIHTLLNMKNDRQAAKELEIEQQYIAEHQQRVIEEFVAQNRAVINAKNHVKELAKDFATNKGMCMRIVYHFHTHPYNTTELTEVDTKILQYIHSGIEVIITSTAVLGYKYEPNEKVQSRLDIEQMHFEIIK